MRSNLNRFLAFSLAGAAVLGAFQGEAFADRRSSLAGNMLIVDQDDVYIYPQLTLEHRNLVSFDYFPGVNLGQVLGRNADTAGSDSGAGTPTPTPDTDAPDVGDPRALGPRPGSTAGLPNGANAMGGSGLLLFGQENFAFGVSTHRQAYYGGTPQSFLGMGDLQLYGTGGGRAWGILGHAGPLPLSNVDDTATPTDNLAPSTASGAGAQFLQPLQMADLLVGFGIGETSLLGARLSIGQNTFRENRLGIDLDDDESWNTTAINLGLGYSMRGPLYLDLNLELGLAFFSNVYHTDEENEPNYNDSGSLAPSFSLSGRSFVPLQESVNLGILGIVHVNSASVTNEFGTAPDSTTTADEAAASSSNFFFEAGAGPMYDLADGTQIAGYGTVGFGSSSHTDESQTLKTSALLLPGFKLALEHWMLDWLAFRTGLSSRYYFGFQSREFEDDSRANVSATASSYEFLWSVGLGVELGNFELNGTVQTPFVTGGPHFIGGTAPGLFALLNATYLF